MPVFLIRPVYFFANLHFIKQDYLFGLGFKLLSLKVALNFNVDFILIFYWSFLESFKFHVFFPQVLSKDHAISANLLRSKYLILQFSDSRNLFIIYVHLLDLLALVHIKDHLLRLFFSYFLVDLTASSFVPNVQISFSVEVRWISFHLQAFSFWAELTEIIDYDLLIVVI